MTSTTNNPVRTEAALSIIIPCYNSEETLHDAVASCFRQNLTQFEIVIVDDGSTDSTYKIMEDLAHSHPEIRIFRHDRNRGGGAARNTAVMHARYDVIFCLDSDDILGDGTLQKMRSYLVEKHCDGVGLHVSKKFIGNDRENIKSSDTFGYVDEQIPLESLLEKNGVLCPLYSVFMFTRQAFTIAGGYPIEHGFDTQTFAWRFLANGLVAYTCPDTVYLHRVQFHESYYLREYRAGTISGNWRHLLSEFLFLFSEDARNIIVGTTTLPFDTDMLGALRATPNALSSDAPNLAKPHSRALYAASVQSASDYYWRARYYLDIGEYTEAMKILPLVSNTVPRSIVVAFQKATRAGIHGATAEEVARIVRAAFPALSRTSLRGIMRRVWVKLYRMLRLATESAEARGYQPDLLLAFIVLKLRKVLRIGFTQSRSIGTHEPIDVVIPTIAKDHELLETVVQSLSNLRHPVRNIIIIAPHDDAVRSVCDRNGWQYLDEEKVLPGIREKMVYAPSGKDRRGWLFQQFLKFAIADVVSTRHYFVIDSDTVLITPQSFILNNKTMFYESAEWHQPYFDTYRRLFGTRAQLRTSSVCHMMLFDAVRVREMCTDIEVQHHTHWTEAILASSDLSQQSCFSEFETYSNWLYKNYPQEMRRVPFYNKSLPRTKLRSLDTLCAESSARYHSLSFHSFTTV